MARRLRRATAVVDTDNSFENAYRVWLTKKEQEWSAIHRKISNRAFERDVLPRLGKLPVGEITSSLLSVVVEDIAKRGAIDTAFKVLQHCSGVFRLAQAKGWCQNNPAEPVREVLPKRKATGGMPAILDFPGLGEILRKADAARLSPAVRMAHRLAAFTTARMGNVTLAEWSEFHLNEEPAVWIIPRPKMKARDRPHDHKIILCTQIVEEIKTWRTLASGNDWLFPSPTIPGLADPKLYRNETVRPISREAVEKAYRATLGLKDKHTPHGWRAAFSTLAKDNGFGRDVVELALDHVHDNDVVRAYDRGERMAERIRLMTWWGEQLMGAQRGGAYCRPGRKRRHKSAVTIYPATADIRTPIFASAYPLKVCFDLSSCQSLDFSQERLQQSHPYKRLDHLSRADSQQLALYMFLFDQSKNYESS